MTVTCPNCTAIFPPHQLIGASFPECPVCGEGHTFEGYRESGRRLGQAVTP